MYTRLPFNEYFTICSEAWNNEDTTNIFMAKYNHVDYYVRKKKHTADYQVRYDESRNCIQILFQQTSGKSDWLANFTFPEKIYDRFKDSAGNIIQLKAHDGWTDMYEAVKREIRKEFFVLIQKYPQAYVEIFGWSLGSGLAQLAAEDIHFKFKVKPYLYTFGSVRPFFGKKTKKYLTECCEKAYNFYDQNDIVGYMVPFFGWFAINHIKLTYHKFSIFNLFKPLTYHTHYHLPEQYKDID